MTFDSDCIGGTELAALPFPTAPCEAEKKSPCLIIKQIMSHKDRTGAGQWRELNRAVSNAILISCSGKNPPR